LGPQGLGDKTWIVSYGSGISRCQINGNKLKYLKTPQALIRAVDPQFSVTIAGRRTTVTVRKGILRVLGRTRPKAAVGGGNPVIVGPNQMTVVRAGHSPSRPTSAPPQSRQEKRDFAQVAAALPNGSVTTAAIQDRAVTTAKLADQAVTLSKLAPDAKIPGP